MVAMGGGETVDVRQAWQLWRASRPDFDEVTLAEVQLLPLAWSVAQREGLDDLDRGRLDGLIRRCAVAGALATTQVTRVVAELESDAVPVVLSGPAATRTYYPDPQLRELRRVDVLATRDHLVAAGRLPGLATKDRMLGRSVGATTSGLPWVVRWRLPGRLRVNELLGNAVLQPTDAAVLVLADMAMQAAPGHHGSMMWAVDSHILMNHPRFDRSQFDATVTRSGLAPLLAAHGRAWQGRLPASLTSAMVNGSVHTWTKPIGATQGHIVGGLRYSVGRLRRWAGEATKG